MSLDLHHRDRMIIEMVHQDGLKVRRVADLTKLSTQRIYQILKAPKNQQLIAEVLAGEKVSA